MPNCYTCGTPVYHAEQTFGPGRKIYHKPCLQCTACHKRLEAGSLVEHDLDPYCANCHKKLFATKDLRHHNHPQAVSPPSSGTFVASESPRLISTSSNPPTSLRSGDGAPLPPSTTSYLPSSKPRPPLPTTPKPSLSPFQPTSSSIQRSISSPVSITHGSNLGQPSSPIPGRSMASLAISSRSPSAQSPKKPIFSPAPTPRCEGCGKSVFMAEQVVALDKKWHKSCLRCIVCGKGLAQGNALEHDNKPTCAPCYKKNFGPQGAGYGLQ